MAVGGVVVVPRAIQIRRHQADRVEAMLATQSLTQLDTTNLGDGIPLVGGLEGPGEQRLFANRLVCELRVNSTAAQK